MSAALVAALALAGCGGGGAADPAQGGGGGEEDRAATLRVGWVVAAGPLDPHTAASSLAQLPYVFPVYDRLLQVVAGRELKPMVASAWRFADDGLSVTFTLRNDVKFHDGTPVDAAAVAASLNRAKTLPASTVRGQLEMVKEVVVVDPQTLRIDTSRPAADLPYVLASPVGSIINPAALNNTDLDRVPAGSGPYTVVDLKLGDRVVYERAPGYWDPEAQKVARIELRGIPNDNARFSALRSGELDVVQTLGTEGAQLAGLGDEFDFYPTPAAQEYSLFLNTDRPNIDKALVRQALNWAVDREAINQGIFDGQCAPTGQPLTAVYAGQGHLESPPIAYGHDPEQARRLLAQAGLPDGFELRVMAPAGLSAQIDIATALQAQLAEVGVRLVIEPIDPVQARGEWKSGTQYDGYVHTRTANPTGALTLRGTYLQASSFPGQLPAGFADAVNSAFDPTLGDEQVAQVLENASAIAVNEAFDLYLCANQPGYVATDRVVGVGSMGQTDFQGVFDLRYVGVLR
ncbi:ABC transporter substrate-binding protein [Pseudonocardia pini]|uniref:ABC transporter substrate-binding protein n=1 Tax=Pseudonocardia pini TaxID=2758030 RepID=UPI0015F0C2A2|nr:ABC transporter substrate-binding protein [Pseudonocardia pini]